MDSGTLAKNQCFMQPFAGYLTYQGIGATLSHLFKSLSLARWTTTGRTKWPASNRSTRFFREAAWCGIVFRPTLKSS